MNLFNLLQMNQMPLKISVSFAAIVLIGGCASAPAPLEQMATAKQSVNSATSAGGNEFAPVQLKSAMDKMDSAERAMQTEDFVLARQLAEQAQVDAQLAAATARSAKAQKAASALQEDNKILRQEIDRNAQ
jgi:hypothetical protein